MEYDHNAPHIRQRGKKSRFYIDNELIDREYQPLLGRSVLVYYALARHANAVTQKCWPSYETLMRETGIKGRSTLSRSLKKLEKLHMISVCRSRGRKSNMYYLLDLSVWLPPNRASFGTVGTVPKRPPQQSQKPHTNSPTGWTGNELTESDKEIKAEQNKGMQKLEDFIHKQSWYKHPKS